MKVQVSQDVLYKYLLEHNVNISLIAKMMGVSAGIVAVSFRHNLNRHGKPMKFSVNNIERLNTAIGQIAEELSDCILNFGSDQAFTNQRGTTYDPSLVEPFKQGVGKYFKLVPFTERVLGWNAKKKDQILCAPSSKVYGQISADDVNRINAELLSVAGVLSSYEVVADEGSSSDSSDDGQSADLQPQTPANADLYYRQLDEFISAISDTNLLLTERYRIYHERYSNGILFFRVNDGYTVAQDDARRLAELYSNIYTYTDPASGLTTAYMSADIYKKVEEECIRNNWPTLIVEMY